MLLSQAYSGLLLLLVTQQGSVEVDSFTFHRHHLSSSSCKNASSTTTSSRQISLSNTNSYGYYNNNNNNLFDVEYVDAPVVQQQQQGQWQQGIMSATTTDIHMNNMDSSRDNNNSSSSSSPRWRCDVCGKGFGSYSAAVEHEKQCLLESRKLVTPMNLRAPGTNTLPKKQIEAGATSGVNLTAGRGGSPPQFSTSRNDAIVSSFTPTQPTTGGGSNVGYVGPSVSVPVINSPPVPVTTNIPPAEPNPAPAAFYSGSSTFTNTITNPTYQAPQMSAPESISNNAANPASIAQANNIESQMSDRPAWYCPTCGESFNFYSEKMEHAKECAIQSRKLVTPVNLRAPGSTTLPKRQIEVDEPQQTTASFPRPGSNKNDVIVSPFAIPEARNTNHVVQNTQRNSMSSH